MPKNKEEARIDIVNEKNPKKDELIYKELSYKIVGFAFEVYKDVGGCCSEKIICNSFEAILKQEGIKYQREHYYPVTTRGKIVGKRFVDFLVDDKIIIEFKVGGDSYYAAYRQLLNYLKFSGLKLGIILRFTKDGVVPKRIANIY